ncbi:MAG: hypothetical protein U1F10_13795 [Burkholderiales bacterium]
MNDAARADIAQQAAHEPVFGLDRTRDLHVRERWQRRAAGTFLAHAVAREPANLVAHVQRILLWLEERDDDQAFGALLDLFIELGTRGIDLRARMLTAGYGIIGDAHRQYLRGLLVTGAHRNLAHPPAPWSVLTHGLRGTLDAVAIDERTGGERYDAVARARDELFAGDVTAAQATLEREVALHPEHAQAGADLLAVYRHTHNLGRLRAVRDGAGTALADRAAWDAAEAELAALRH